MNGPLGLSFNLNEILSKMFSNLGIVSIAMGTSFAFVIKMHVILSCHPNDGQFPIFFTFLVDTCPFAGPLLVTSALALQSLKAGGQFPN